MKTFQMFVQLHDFIRSVILVFSSVYFVFFFFDCFRSYFMISEFGFLAFILFFVYNLATGTVSFKCFNVLYVL